MPYLEENYLNRLDAPHLLSASINAFVTACLRRKTSGAAPEEPRLRLQTPSRNSLKIKRLPNLCSGAPRSNPLGMTCQPYNRCAAARSSVCRYPETPSDGRKRAHEGYSFKLETAILRPGCSC